MRPSLAQAIRLIKQRWPQVRSAAADAPVFVLAAGWRSGSTLLQRMLFHKCMMWGEPFGHTGLIDSLTQPLRCLLPDWPPDGVFLDHPSWGQDLSGQMVANLFPPFRLLQDAHVAYFQQMFAVPSGRQGLDRWGIKEVRWGIDHALYLQWLFPRARFLFLIRNPYECWSSYRRNQGVWYRTWPDDPMDSPEAFGQHWNSLTEGFLNRGFEVDGRLIRYEDLVSGDLNLRSLTRYLGFSLNLEVRELRINVSPLVPIPPEESDRFHDVVAPLAEFLGYQPPTRSQTRKRYGTYGTEEQTPRRLVQTVE